MLSEPRRRYVLYCLDRYSTPMELADVAELVLVWEHAGCPDDYLRERLYTYNDLYHEHLPVLCEADLVEYDQSEDVVSPGPAAAEVEPALERYRRSDLGDVPGGTRNGHGDALAGPSPTDPTGRDGDVSGGSSPLE